MKKLFVITLLFLATALTTSGAASTEGRAKFVFTGIPNNNDSLTFRGDTRTFKTVVTSSSTQILIGASAVETANNFVAHLATYPFSNTAIQQISTTNVNVIADVDLSVTASVSGSWGTVTVTTTTLTQRPIALPFATERTATRTNDANDLILALNYASSAFAANVAALSNYVNTTAAQTITGAKLFSGATVISNSNARLYLLLASNIVITNSVAHFTTAYVDTLRSYGVLYVSNAFPALNFWTVGGSSNEKNSFITTYGDQWRLVFSSDDAMTSNDVFMIDRSGATPTTFNLYTKLVPYSTGIGIEGGLWTNGVSTNAIGGFSAAYVDGLLQVTANAGIISLVDSGGTANDKTTHIVADNDSFIIRFKNDAGSTVSNPFTISRTDGVASLITLAATLVELPATAFSGAVNIDADLYVSTALVTGDNTPTLPSGFSAGLYFLDSTSPSADPTTGTVLWSLSGAPKYRSSGSGEGSGGTFYLHNRTSTTVGAGTDYTLTSSTAAVDFGTTDPTFTAPTTGTYFIWADMAITAGGTGGDTYQAKLRNTTAAADLTGNDQAVTFLGASEVGSLKLICTATLAASDVVALYAHNNTAARGTVNSARTRIGYVRLY